jgi:regulatory protein
MNCNDYFLRLLSRREYSVQELVKKGLEKGFERAEIDAVIQTIQEKDYQSDSRLVTSIINSYQGKYGKSVLKRKCIEKGIPGDLFEQIWTETSDEKDAEDDLTELRDKIMRKYKLSTFKNIDQKTKSKVLNYLQYRGFNGFQLLDRWKIEEEENY